MAILCKIFRIRFLATDFNIGTISITLQIALQYSIHKVFTGRLLIFLQLRTSRGYLLPRTCSADCLQDNSSTRIPQKTPSSFVKDACLQLRCLAIDVLLFRAFAWRGPHRKHSFPYIVVTFLKEGVYRPSDIPVWRRGRIPPP
jgi:hypothetical protein